MRLPKDQPFWTSVILHCVVLLGLFLATIVQAFKPKEKPHVFEMVSQPSQAESTSVASPDPQPVLDVPEVELPPVPDVSIPKPAPRPVETVKPQPTPSKPKPQPKTMSYEEFLRQNPIKEPTQRPRTPKPNISVPKIDVPQLVIPRNTSPNVSDAPLSQQQLSALGTYSGRLRSRIDAAWGKPGQLAGVRISATVLFDVSASGRVSNVRLSPSSGNAAFDQSVLAAFRKVSSAGPTPTGQPHTFTMTFRMTD